MMKKRQDDPKVARATNPCIVQHDVTLAIAIRDSERFYGDRSGSTLSTMSRLLSLFAAGVGSTAGSCLHNGNNPTGD